MLASMRNKYNLKKTYIFVVDWKGKVANVREASSGFCTLYLQGRTVITTYNEEQGRQREHMCRLRKHPEVRNSKVTSEETDVLFDGWLNGA